MRTLDEIEQSEDADRDRAWRFGRLKDQRDRLQATIRQLTATSPDAADTLTQIRDLAATLDPTLVSTFPVPHTRTEAERQSGVGLTLVGAGFPVRFVLAEAAASALASLARKTDKAAARLASARAELAAVEAALADFQE